MIWSCSPQATAEVFSDLKHRQPDPDRETSLRIGVEDEATLNSEFNPAPQEVLKNIPGITSKNYKLIMTRVHSLSALFKMEKAELVEILGEINGGKVFDFVNKDPRES